MAHHVMPAVPLTLIVEVHGTLGNDGQIGGHQDGDILTLSNHLVNLDRFPRGPSNAYVLEFGSPVREHVSNVGGCLCWIRIHEAQPLIEAGSRTAFREVEGKYLGRSSICFKACIYGMIA